MVLEPRFEEYSFLTPKDVAGEAFIVTIRYLLTVYDGSGARVDSFAFTGYGREKAHTLASKEPLAIATQRAMRDAGAKVAVELTDQESVRLLLHGAGSPLPPSPPQPPDQLQPPPAPSRRAAAGRKRAGRSASLSRSRHRRQQGRDSRLRTNRPPRSLLGKAPRRRRPPGRKPPSVDLGEAWRVGLRRLRRRSRIGVGAGAGVEAGGTFAGSISSYHSLVNVTPAVETALPSEKRGL